MIRQALISDLPKVAECAREFYATSPLLADLDETRFCETWSRLILQKIGVAFIEYEGAEVAGGLGAVVTQDPFGQKVIASESFWFVRETARGSLGIRLFRVFEDWARVNGVGSIQMIHLLDETGEKAKKFYLRSGYKPVEVRYQKRLVA